MFEGVRLLFLWTERKVAVTTRRMGRAGVITERVRTKMIIERNWRRLRILLARMSRQKTKRREFCNSYTFQN